MRAVPIRALSLCVAAAIVSACAPSTGVPAATPIRVAVETQSGLKYAVLYSFGSYPTDGVNPEASLTGLNGVLYGTTVGGGSGCYASGGCGTVFAVARSGTESVLHSFGDGEDGALPYAGLTTVDGVLYGTTGGGASTGGTVYSITTSGTETVLHNFEDTPDGSDPQAGLLAVDGTLYGATVFGGAKHYGTAFQISTSGAERVLYSFLGTQRGGDGKYPEANPLDINGTLYGTTYKGGAVDRGTVFKMTLSGGETVLHSFIGGATQGSYPRAGLVYFRGTFYGTTSGGGNPACKGCGKNLGDGTVFAITPSGKEKVIYKFKGYPTDGAFPYGKLLFHNGIFYGTTQSGGANCAVSGGCGTIFSITPSGTEKMLYSFLPKEGSFPVAGLIELNGKFYGTTPLGGEHNHGAIFSLTAPNDRGNAK